MNEAIESLLQAHLDGELSPEEVALVEAALAEDPAARAAHQELAALGGLLSEMYSSLAATDVPVEVPGVPVPSERTPTPATVGEATPAPAGGERPAAGGARSTGKVSRPPRQIAGYRIERELARGGMGRVYRAHQLSLDRPVALKVLAPEWTENEQFVARFLREARLAGTIRHANLVQIYEVGEHGEGADRCLWYSMELIEGEDAEQLLNRAGTVPQRRAVEIALGVARALSAASAKGIVHRDIKPANVLLTSDGGVKLADLGLAKGEGGGDGSVTMKKTVIGSPNYMSPEQAQDIRGTDTRSDVYSLGATILHLVSGEAPFGTGTPIEVLARVLRDAPALPDVVGGEAFDPALRGLVARCLEKDPAARYQTPDELARELEAWLAGSLEAPASGERTSQRTSRRSGRRSSSDVRRLASERIQAGRDLRPLLAAAAAVLLAGLGFLFLRDREASDPGLAQVPSPSVTELPPEQPPTPRATRVQPTPAPTRIAPPAPSREPAPALPPGVGEALDELVRFDEQHPEQVGERFRRARAFLERHRDTPAAGRARELLHEAEQRLGALRREADSKALALIDLGQLDRARGVYQEYLREHGQDVPGQGELRLALTDLDTRIGAALDRDLPRVQGMLDAGQRGEALALLDEIELYAGPAERREQRAQLRAGASPATPQPSASPTPQPGPSPAPSPAPADRAVALTKAREELEAILALAQGGKLEEARARFPAARKAAAEFDELREKVAEVAALVDPPPPGWPELASAVLYGKLTVAAPEGQAQPKEGEEAPVPVATLAYDWKAPEQAQDWRLPHHRGDKVEPIRRYLLGLEEDGGSKVEPWQVIDKRETLAGFGHDRRRAVLSFSPDAPCEIRVSAKALHGTNFLVAIGEKRPVIAGVGYLLPELPVARGAPGEVRNAIRRAAAISRQRGPVAAVFYEERPMFHEDVAVGRYRLAKNRKVAMRVTYEPLKDVEGVDARITVWIGKKKVVEADVAHEGPVVFSLLTLGSGIAYEEIELEGVPSKQFRDRLSEAYQQAKSKESDPLREAFRKKDDRKAD